MRPGHYVAVRDARNVGTSETAGGFDHTYTFSIEELALDDLNTTLRFDPNSPQMLFMRGAAHRALENKGEAIADLERALELGLPPELADQAEQALRDLREGFF